MDCRIYEPTVIIRDDSVVSVDASLFGDKDRAEKYYRVVIRLVEAGKCARVKGNEDSTMSIENIDDLVLEKEVPKRKSLSYEKSLSFEFNPQILNGQVTSNFKQYLFQISLQLHVTLLLDKLSLINTILVNNIVPSLSL